MKRSPEEELDRRIDELNAERAPRPTDDPEEAELLAVVRTVRSLRAPAAPTPALGVRIRKALTRRFSGTFERRRRLYLLLPFPSPALRLAVGVAAGLLLGASILWLRPVGDRDAVLAMERAVERLAGYHGVLEKRMLDADGSEWPVRRLEIWSEGDRYATRDEEGVLTVNDGERRWQVRPAERTVAVLPLLPDPRGFDLRAEAERAMRYPHRVVGRERVAGREAIRVQIEPPGGLPYDLWIDAATDMPLQLRTAMQNALQTISTFVRFEANPPIDPAIFRFDPPAGYQVIEEDPGQRVDTPAEAALVAGFTPLLPEEPPARILAFEGRIVLDHGGTTVIETPSEAPFEPAPHGSIGRAAGGPLEVTEERLRWQQDGIEIRVEGERRLELARQIAPDLSLPDPGQDLTSPAKVRVPVDMEVVRRNQQQVDAGHSPWQLDPVYVAVTFVNLQVSPGGIVGEPPIPFDAFTLVADTGAEAVVDVSEGPIARVYLKRLVRQDETGIWTVVGYDPREEAESRKQPDSREEADPPAGTPGKAGDGGESGNPPAGPAVDRGGEASGTNEG